MNTFLLITAVMILFGLPVTFEKTLAGTTLLRVNGKPRTEYSTPRWDTELGGITTTFVEGDEYQILLDSIVIEIDDQLYFHDSGIALTENTLKFPIPDGGGATSQLDPELLRCSNAPRTSSTKLLIIVKIRTLC